MSGFTHIEKQKLERELGMSGGYVSERLYQTSEKCMVIKMQDKKNKETIQDGL